jgi:hypothetical protein
MVLLKILWQHNLRVNRTPRLRLLGFGWLVGFAVAVPIPERRLEFYTKTDDDRLVGVFFYTQVKKVFFLGRVAIADSHAKREGLWQYGLVCVRRRALLSIV